MKQISWNTKTSHKNSSMTDLCSMNISVTIEGHTHKITLPHPHVTTGWIFSQVQKEFDRVNNDNKKKVVGIGVEDSNETMNYYLTLLDR